MRILSLEYGQAFKYITEGWKNVFEATGHQWAWLNGDKPAFDAFNEFEPDIFLGTTYDLDRAVVKCIKQRPNMAVVLKGQNWGPLDKEIKNGGPIPAKTYDKSYAQTNQERVDNEADTPVGVSDEREQERICGLREQIDNKMLVYNLYHKNRMKETMGYWDDHGVETIDMQPAADHFKHQPASKIDMLESDISFIGGYWAYKGINIDQYLLPLCYPIGKYNIKIFGYHEWPVPQFLGPIQDHIMNNVYCCAKICPNVSEPHANEFGFEVNERVFKLSACKAFCLSDHIDSLVEDIFTDGEMPTAKSPQEFHEKIDYYLSNPQSRQDHAERCYETVMKNHTYCHRVANLLSRLDLNEDAGKCLDIVNAGECHANT